MSENKNETRVKKTSRAVFHKEGKRKKQGEKKEIQFPRGGKIGEFTSAAGGPWGAWVPMQKKKQEGK